MQRTGIANLPLHGGKAPHWLTIRMRKLAKETITILINEHGTDTFLTRTSDPYWFQAFGCALGYDWHSSGVTTVVTAILKQALSPQEHGIAICGGKGKTSRQTPTEITNAAEKFGLSNHDIEALRYASRMSAKVDNTAIQDGYQLYHHTFFITENNKWAVIQQGMSPEDHTARRYHWLSTKTTNFTVEPHNAIICDTKRPIALNMTAKTSEGCRKTSVDIAKEPPQKTIRLITSITPTHQKTLQQWLPTTPEPTLKKYPVDILSMPRRINWKTLREVYEFQPKNYEQLLGFRGIGPATIRGLALIAELIYGEKPSWKDPVKYSFAYGGKDGVPFPVNRKAMDESVQILRQAIQDTKIGEKEKIKSLQRLTSFISDNINS